MDFFQNSVSTSNLWQFLSNSTFILTSILFYLRLIDSGTNTHLNIVNLNKLGIFYQYNLLIAFSIYDLYGHAPAQEPLPRGSWNL